MACFGEGLALGADDDLRAALFNLTAEIAARPVHIIESVLISMVHMATPKSARLKFV